MTTNTLNKWWKVYANDEEKRFFVGNDGKSGLVRNNQFDWRSTDALSRESGLSKTRIEEIIFKYHKTGIVVQHSQDSGKWGYWEKVNPNADQIKKSLSEDDKDKRIDKAKKKI